MNRLKGKVILVTGAGNGIGRATALAMAMEGALVWATDRDELSLLRFANEPSIKTLKLDVADESAVADLTSLVGKIDALFNCAGYVHSGSILNCTDSDWDITMSINLKSMFHTTKAFLPSMISAGGGSIVNMSSIASSVKGVPNRFAYSASKAGVIGLTKSVAIDFIKKGIRCNAICPGIVDTPSLAQRLNQAPDPAAARRSFIERQPTGRMAQADEIAPLVIYLTSDESCFVTGAVYSIDGGISL